MAEGKAETESGVEPFRWWIFRNRVETLDEMPPISSDAWEARYENSMELHKRTSRKIEMFGKSIQRTFRILTSSAYEMEWSRRLGYNVRNDPDMHGGGIHATGSGGVLSCHLDYARHPYIHGFERRINLIAFLNPEWKEEWGGALCLCDPFGNPVKRIYPEPGMLAAFETSDLSYHGVEPVTGPVDRVTAAVYYLSELREGVTRVRALFMPVRKGNATNAM